LFHTFLLHISVSSLAVCRENFIVADRRLHSLLAIARSEGRVQKGLGLHMYKVLYAPYNAQCRVAISSASPSCNPRSFRNQPKKSIKEICDKSPRFVLEHDSNVCSIQRPCQFHYCNACFGIHCLSLPWGWTIGILEARKGLPGWWASDRSCTFVEASKLGLLCPYLGALASLGLPARPVRLCNCQLNNPFKRPSSSWVCTWFLFLAKNRRVALKHCELFVRRRVRGPK